MDIDFKSEKLRKVCSNSQYATKEIGAACARKLQSRLADICAATTIFDVIAGKPHPLKGKGQENQLSFQLDKKTRLVIEPADEPIPYQTDGHVDWAEVNSVKVVYIGNYHE